MATTIRYNDKGWTHTITVQENAVPVNVSTMTLANAWRLVPPSGPARLRTPAFVTDGSDGKLKYTAITGDFDQVGQWQVQVSVILPGGLTVISAAALVDVQAARQT